MNPLHLKLTGFRGIRDGLRRSEFTLDLASLDPSAKVVALFGPNGRGKTTVLDNLQPFPILPSRASSYSLAAFSMYDHIVAPEATKDLTWSHNGRVFRSVCVWRISGKRKSVEAYLFEQVDGHEVPVSAPDGTVSDGKMETYVSVLVQLLAPPDVYFASHFSAQGRKKLSDYKEGEIKLLLAEMLNLGDLQAVGAKASAVVKGLSSAIDALRASLAGQQGNLADLSTLKATHAQAVTTLAQQQALLATAETNVANAQQQATTEEAALARQEGVVTARAGIERELQRIGEEEANQNTAHQNKVAELAKQNLQAGDAARTTRARIDRDILQRQAEVTVQNTLLAQKDAILAAPAQVKQLDEQIAKAELELKTAREAMSTLTTLQGEAKAAGEKVAGLRDNYASAKKALEGIRVRAALSQEVPCKGTDLQSGCKLLADALAALQQVPTDEAKLAALGESGSTAKAALTALQEKIAAYKAPDVPMPEQEKALSALRTARDTTQALALKQPLIEQAQQLIATATAALLQLRAELEALEVAEKQRATDHTALVEAETVRITAARTAFAQQRTALNAELAKHPLPDRARLIAAQAALAGAQTALRAQQTAVATAQAALHRAEVDVRAGEVREGMLSAQKARLASLTGEHASWQLLARAFGRDGLVSMLIDEAGPTLAALANEILLDCYGPRFSLSIETQKTLANGTLAESFDILVHDAEADEPKSLVYMSGGQRVWINEALSRAIALYLGQSSGLKCDALFSDEADGALDAERKQMFMAMMRKVADMGPYERTFFISQTPELHSKADLVIEIA